MLSVEKWRSRTFEDDSVLVVEDSRRWPETGAAKDAGANRWQGSYEARCNGSNVLDHRDAVGPGRKADFVRVQAARDVHVDGRVESSLTVRRGAVARDGLVAIIHPIPILSGHEGVRGRQS